MENYSCSWVEILNIVKMVELLKHSEASTQFMSELQQSFAAIKSSPSNS